jgi:hypothetical protein
MSCYEGLAVEMDLLFKKWMAWYGKKYSPYKLYQGRQAIFNIPTLLSLLFTMLPLG